MPRQESGKGNLKFFDLKVAGVNFTSRKRWKSFVSLWLIVAA